MITPIHGLVCIMQILYFPPALTLAISSPAPPATTSPLRESEHDVPTSLWSQQMRFDREYRSSLGRDV